jgi:hypothetical protein
MAVVSRGEKIKVMYINHGRVWADKEILHEGTVFSSDAKISWEDDKQVIKIIGFESHNVSIVPVQTLITGKMTTISELLIQKQRLSSRGGVFTNLQSLSAFLYKSIALMNTIWFETGFSLDDNHFFFLQYDRGNETINKRLPFNDHCFCLNDEIYIIDGVSYTPITLAVRLCYYEVEEMRATTITDYLTIKIEPRNICLKFLRPYLSEEYTRDELMEMLEDYCKIQFPDCYFDRDDLLLFCNEVLECK